MIKEVTVVICDLCGRVERATVAGYQYNEPYYGPPAGWLHSKANNDVHLCPSCAGRMVAKEAAKKAAAEVDNEKA